MRDDERRTPDLPTGTTTELTGCQPECPLERPAEGLGAVKPGIERGVEDGAALLRGQASRGAAQTHHLHIARDRHPHIARELAVKVIGREAGNPTQHRHGQIAVQMGIDVGEHSVKALRVGGVGGHSLAGVVSDMGSQAPKALRLASLAEFEFFMRHELQT
ncbi:hypothetical protein THIARS_60178 [Thiomonas delicata]|uniref:Uncharacterized protein n=1 Tax=Thiomonas delicata TaxID=364030 RepID=A0A238D2J3_THIDL|nr:hypothetical protein THIARS_60178 [Thiomonas delicata]